MRFETFSCYTKREKQRKSRLFMGFDFIPEIINSLVSPIPEFLCETRTWRPDEKKFAIVLCCANNEDEDLIGKKYALELGIRAMQAYLNREVYGIPEILKKMSTLWRRKIRGEYRVDFGEEKSLLRDVAPFFLAIAGDKDRALLVQYGAGCFVLNQGDKCQICSLENSKYSSAQGFAMGSKVYFQELNSIPDAAVMVNPYCPGDIRAKFKEFTERIAEEKQTGVPHDREFCMEPFEVKIRNQEKQTNQPLGIAGYWKNVEPQSYGQRQRYAPSHPQGYAQQQNYHQAQPRGINRPNLQRQKQREQRLQQLADIKKELQVKEQQLARLKQMENDIQRQKQNLDAEHEKILNWVKVQKNYLDSKKKLNEYPHG